MPTPGNRIDGEHTLCAEQRPERGTSMSYQDAADKAEQGAVAARAVQEATTDESQRGLAEAIALIADAIQEMSDTHHRQF
jgi:hypothetical protein